MFSVKSIEQFPHNGGTVFVIGCPVECPRDNPKSVLGERIVIDGTEHAIHAVERNMPLTPIREGEKIGIHTRL